MKWVHIHIEGIVQGVGFRPFVFKLASKLDVKGSVRNGVDGVHIEAGGSKVQIEIFLYLLKDKCPVEAVITSFTCKEIEAKQSTEFLIIESETSGAPKLLITPDLGLCETCRNEIERIDNRRYNYPFTTCTRCGPRYSIIKSLPYDRHTTSMEAFAMCPICETEYHDPFNRRHFSQTNSCARCSIEMKLTTNTGSVLATEWNEILPLLLEALKAGKIAAVKGIGGYLLMTDATNPDAIKRLRERKHRSSKPFALMYANIEMLEGDAILSASERKAFESMQSPIVLVTLKPEPASGICINNIAPGLAQVGAMRAYTAMFHLLLKAWNKPIVATSGNVSGAPIQYNDQQAQEALQQVADIFLIHNREIQISEDDSMLRFADEHQMIMRRSRGYAPTYLNPTIPIAEQCVLALGADMKSAFALQANGRIYVSQYLGDLESYDSQEFFKHTLEHLLRLLQVRPQQVIVDAHPTYYSTQLGTQLAKYWGASVEKVYHHHAHAWAVLAENNLLQTEHKTLCVVWDGTGYGTDKQIWGGEFFIYEKETLERSAHLAYTPVWQGDTMAREPRISALFMCRDFEERTWLRNRFTEQEWVYYARLIQSKTNLHTSSMGRLFDCVASLLNVCNHNSFEGEAAMLLETAARQGVCDQRYAMTWRNQQLETHQLLKQIIEDIVANISIHQIAFKFHAFLADSIYDYAKQKQITHVALTGGVFQNALLIKLIKIKLDDQFVLHLHKELSCNDENIALGQLACAQVNNQPETVQHQMEEETLLNNNLCV